MYRHGVASQTNLAFTNNYVKTTNHAVLKWFKVSVEMINTQYYHSFVSEQLPIVFEDCCKLYAPNVFYEGSQINVIIQEI